MSILNITEPTIEDNSIIEYEVHEYEPITGTNLNNPSGEIRITINAQQLYTQPSESYLIFEGDLVKDNNSRYNDADNISLTNNGLMYLFKYITYKLNNETIEDVSWPGQVTTMLGLLKYTYDFSKSQGLNQLWYKDTGLTADNRNTGFEVRRRYIMRDPNTAGTFSFKVPLKHIFGFCEDYDKVIYGMKQNLTLVRNNNQEAIFRSNQDAAGNALVDGKVILKKVSWFVPHVVPRLEEANNLLKLIEKKEKFPVGYRRLQCQNHTVDQSREFSWNLSASNSTGIPRFMIFGFQTKRRISQEVNSALFDNLEIRNFYVYLDSVRYPAIDYNIDFSEQNFSKAYGDAASFRSKFFKIDELVSNPDISPSDYKSFFPLFVIDVSKQIEKIKDSSINILVKMFFKEIVPAETEVFAVIIGDRLLNFSSDGSKMLVIN